MSPAKPKTAGCRVCGKSTRGGGRGLCQKHYRRWKAKFDSFSDPGSAERFEAECLEGGWIAPKKVGGRPREDEDPFDAIAERVRQGTPAAPADVDDAELEREARRAEVRSQVKGKGKQTTKRKRGAG